jgi:hypothetical protein
MPYFILYRKQRTLATAAFNARPQQSLLSVGRFSGFRFVLLAAPSHPKSGQWLYCGVRQRLQRRDRNGIAPFSLLSYVSARLTVTDENRTDRHTPLTRVFV